MCSRQPMRAGPRMGRVASVCCFATGLLLAGCAESVGSVRSYDEASADRDVKAQALQSFETECPATASSAKSATPNDEHLRPSRSHPSVFVDAAIFEVPARSTGARLPNAIAVLRDDPLVHLLGTPHVLAEVDRDTTLSIQERTGPVVRSTLKALSVVPVLANDQRTSLELDIVLYVPSEQSALSSPIAPRESRIRMTVAPREGKPLAAIAPVPQQPGRWIVVLVVTYVVRSQGDLRAIFQCKMTQRQRSLRGS